MTIFKLDFLRRGHIADVMRNELAQKGPLSFAKSVLSMRGLMEDRALAARYRAWEKLPEGTLGRSLIDFYNQHGFSVPGERGGFPEAGLYHDFSHLLGGYSTEPEGEIQVASFISGFKRERSFYVVLFVVLIFSAGVNMRPTADDFVTDFGPILSLFFTDPDGLEGEVCVANPDAVPGVMHPPGTRAARYS